MVVHPQSVIHSIVQFEDGSMKAQMGLPDMRLPIQYAIGYPQRLPNAFPRFNFLAYPTLSFESVDSQVFKNLDLAFQALARGGNLPCILNAANEVTNGLFRKGHIGFLQIADLNEQAMEEIEYVEHPTLADLLQADQITRDWVSKQFPAI